MDSQAKTLEENRKKILEESRVMVFRYFEVGIENDGERYPYALVDPYVISPDGEIKKPIKKVTYTPQNILEIGGAEEGEVHYEVSPSDLVFEVRIALSGHVPPVEDDVLLLQLPTRYTQPMIDTVDVILGDLGYPFPYRKKLGIRVAPPKPSIEI